MFSFMILIRVKKTTMFIKTNKKKSKFWLTSFYHVADKMYKINNLTINIIFGFYTRKKINCDQIINNKINWILTLTYHGKINNSLS